MPEHLKLLARIFPVLLPVLCDSDTDPNPGNAHPPPHSHPRVSIRHKSAHFSDQFDETNATARDTNTLVDDPLSLYEAWLASRTYVTQVASDGQIIRQPRPPGSTRQFNLTNLYLAFHIIQSTFVDMTKLLWGLNPIRTFILVALTIVRGLLPAFRGYSHALILDEVSPALLVSIVASKP
jgi:hypothetical protein